MIAAADVSGSVHTHERGFMIPRFSTRPVTANFLEIGDAVDAALDLSHAGRR